MNKKLSRRERKKMETRQRLMEVALQLFRKHGYAATTVKQIAETADVAKGTFFNYFKTKDTILPALAEWQLQQLEDALLPERGAPASPVARIKLALRLVAEDPLTDPTLAQRLFTTVMQQQGEAHPGLVLAHLLADQVCQAQTAGEIRADLDPYYVGGVIRAMLFQRIMMWHCGHRSATLPEMLNATVDLLLNGIAGPNWRPIA
ncbi:MAG: TetR/AcrR family transcriptional regulator [Chloroflexota bacterium]|nr:TetR/AcrR family transcriptional regulator [Chloroflexota bacterium]